MDVIARQRTIRKCTVGLPTGNANSPRLSAAKGTPLLLPFRPASVSGGRRSTLCRSAFFLRPARPLRRRVTPLRR
jgi:hypothetical protein